HLRPPFVMGYGVIGEIDQLGDSVSGFQIGERVADMTVVGSNASFSTLRADRLTRVPMSLDPAEAATLILSWTTAYQLLHRAARVQAGQRAVVHGAAGAVGQVAAHTGRNVRSRAMGHSTSRAGGIDPRARRDADRLPGRRLHTRPAGRVRCDL